MHRKIAVFVLLQCMAIFACHLKSDIPRSERSIIGVPTFLSDRFAQEQRRTVIGYDGQCRQMFEDRERYSSSCSSQPKAQLAAQPEKQQYVRNDDAWWLAVIDNANRNNEQLLQREIETKEVCTKFQWTSQYNQ